MAGDDDFDLRLGRIGRDASVRSGLRRAVNLARGGAKVAGSGRRFTGERIGRGASIGRLVGAGRSGHHYARRVVVKARIVKLAGKGAARAVAHLRYLQRDGTTRAGERGTLYAADRDVADGRAFLERGAGDRHHFRFIVAAEDGAEYDDLKPLVRRLMAQAEHDLGTRLDWVAVDHFNTGHPHSHILLRGTDERGADLVIAREYISAGLRARAAELVSLDLGPRTEREILAARHREVEQERFTSIDRRLVRAIDRDGLVSPAHHEGVEQAARAGRLQALRRFGLAAEERRGVWRLDPALERRLDAIARRGEIVATLQAELGRRGKSRSAADYAIYDPADGVAPPLVGRVLASGLADELADRRYVIVEGVDGLAHHVEVGGLAELPKPAAIVRVSAKAPTVRAVDRTVAEIASRNDGRYSVDLHRRHDPAATDAFAETHVRRLEALRRAEAGVERQADGSWLIASDHLERVAAHERRAAERAPVAIQTLTTRRLDRLVEHDGATWLDRELVADAPAKLGRGFGAEVRQALQARRQWLIGQGLATAAGLDRSLVDTLQRREVVRVGTQLAGELGLSFAEPRRSEEVSGVLRRAVTVGDARFALVERSRDFTLVPWRPVLERRIGQEVSGIMRGATISWTLGRGRGLEIG